MGKGIKTTSINNSAGGFLISEKTVNSIIVLNTVCIFLEGFPAMDAWSKGVLGYVDMACVVYFLIEVILKLRDQKGTYFKSGWNRYDFTVTVLSLPSLIIIFFPQATWLASASVLRAGRLLRFLRLLKFIPNVDHLFRGVSRACKASVGVFFALALLNITLALVATMLFAKVGPEHFGDPLKSSYSLLKMFTIEGWYEIPDTIASENPNLWIATVLRIYAIATVLVGGILGMGLANAIFIDEMTADNNDKLEEKVDLLSKQLELISLDIKTLNNRIP